MPWYRGFLSDNNCRTVLEVGAGTGHLALEMRQQVAQVTVVEPSKGMFQYARAVLSDTDIEIRNITVEDLELDRYYEAVISHLCIQTVDDPRAFLQAMARHVAPEGNIVVALPHPCFYNAYKGLIPASEYHYMTESFREISFTISLDPNRPIDGVPYYHRPLSAYIRALSDSGFHLRDLHEMFPSSEVQKLYPSGWEEPRYAVLVGERA